MCGICGFVFQETRAGSNLLGLMMKEIEHRGPDDTGYAAFEGDQVFFENSKRYCAPKARVFFGHHRLSILDLSKLG